RRTTKNPSPKVSLRAFGARGAIMTMRNMPRRTFLQTGAISISGLAIGNSVTTAAGPQIQNQGQNKPTNFQIACMTLPYSRFPLQRALTGIRNAGYRYVAWGTSHSEGGKQMAVLTADAPPARARELASRCRDLGLEPVMMFSGIYPEAKNGL